MKSIPYIFWDNHEIHVMLLTQFYERRCKMEDQIITNEQGGKQSKIHGQISEVPPLGLRAVAQVMEEGSKKYPREKDGTPNWHRIDSVSNLDHGLLHAINFLAERNKPSPESVQVVPETKRKWDVYMYEELSHHAARALMALEMFIIENNLHVPSYLVAEANHQNAAHRKGDNNA